MIPTGDSQVVKDIALRYCCASLFLYSSAFLFLYFSDYYLLAGRKEYLHFLAVFVVFEILKWIYHKVAVEKDLRLTYKKKPLSYFSLAFKCFDIVHLLRSLICVMIGSLAYHFLAVIFGADIFSKYEETYIFALSMSVLTVLPMCLNFGVQSIVHLVSGLRPGNSLHQVIYRNFQCTVFGAWSGAVVIPLDWDRPWQMWPIPCSFGALSACSLSYVFIYLHLYLVNSNFCILKKMKLA